MRLNMQDNLLINSQFSEVLKRKISKENRKKVFLCIGTSKVPGDSLGPIVGSYLKENTNLEVFGTLRENICEKNKIEELKIKLSEKCIVVIDSAISDYNNLGKIFVSSNQAKIGAGLRYNKGKVGTISIKGVVAENKTTSFENFCNLNIIDLNFIKDMAKIISIGIKESMIENK